MLLERVTGELATSQQRVTTSDFPALSRHLGLDSDASPAEIEMPPGRKQPRL